MFLTDSTDINRIHFSSKLNLERRSALGQFLTPAPIARLIAGQFNNLSGHIHLLDPGAGIGALTAAFVERVLENPQPVESCLITAYEVEPKFLDSLKESLENCCMALTHRGIQADCRLRTQSFIEAAAEIELPFFSSSVKFTHAILNPPYKKISSQSIEKKFLEGIGVETVNLYSAFVWLAMLQLAEEGEISAITPRSFCNGTYFRPFRKAFLEKMRLNKIHVFESRSAVFSEDKILQENIIFHAIKTRVKPDFVEITLNSGNETNEPSEIRTVPYCNAIGSSNSEMIIHVVSNSLEDILRVQMEKFPSTLSEIGLEVSTGAIVDFRLKSALETYLNEKTVPLLYPESIKAGKMVLIEAVTSHGPVDLKRRNELKQLFQSSQKGLVSVTAFPSRQKMTRYLAEISWETEVWVADQPEHMIHFNGERFLGPYDLG